MPEEIRSLLKQLRGGAAQDEAVVCTLRSFGLERLMTYLREMLGVPDPELRCQAALAIFYVAPIDGLELLVGLLDDVESFVRWHTCGLLHDIGESDNRGQVSLARAIASIAELGRMLGLGSVSKQVTNRTLGLLPA